MTEKFIRIIEDSSDILDAVLDVMCFGKFPPEAVLIRTYRPFLSMVENYIRYYEDDVENQKMPVFLAFEQDESTKEILVEYLATRQTLFNPTTRDNVIREATKSFNVVTKSRKVKFCHPMSDKNGRMSLQDIEIKFCKYIYKKVYQNPKLATFIQTKEADYPICDLLVCRANLRPLKQTDVIKKYFSEEGFNPAMALSFNTQNNAQLLLKNDAGLKSIPQNEAICGNGFMIYTRAEFGRFSPGDLGLITNRTGYDMANMFVFVLVDKPFSLGSLSRYTSMLRSRFSNEYAVQPFFLDSDEIKYVNGQSPVQREKILIGTEEDYISYAREVRYILDACDGLRHSVRNLLALCCDRSFEIEFANILADCGVGEIEFDDLSIFDYMRSVWNQIVDRVLEQVGDDTEIAFVIEKLGFESPILKDAIRGRFPQKTVNFYLMSDLRHSENIKERHIFQLRYWGFDAHYISYPNSYDVTILDSNKKLADIIPLVLFASSVSRSENAISAFYNSLQNTPYRKDCLGWSKRKMVESSVFLDDDDDGVDSVSQSYGVRVCVEFTDGRTYTRDDGEEVAYITELEEINFAKLSDFLEFNENLKIQFMDELENYLSEIVTKQSLKDSPIEGEIRNKLIQEGKMDDIPNVEIWRAMLHKRVKILGLDKVVSDLQPLIGHLYKNLEETIKTSWIDFNNIMTLPNRKLAKPALFTYLGIPRFSPYWGIVQRRKEMRSRETRRKHSLVNKLIKAILNIDIKDGYYNILYGQIPDSLDLLGIMSDDDLRFIQANLQNEAINFREVKNIVKVIQHEE